MKYAYCDQIGWHIEIVDEAYDVWQYTILANDTSNRTFINYYDSTNYDLILAHRTASPPVLKPDLFLPWRGELPAIPIWADGMVRAICQVYPTFADTLPMALKEGIGRSGSIVGNARSVEQQAQSAYTSLFFTDQIRPVASNDQRNAILWNPDPAVIVASSGMLAGGPSLSYARSLAAKPENAILLTGYQDEESPGRRLQELSERGSGSIRLGGEKVDVQCHIASYSLSAHADESQIINLTETLAPEHVLLVHGDAARASLEKALKAPPAHCRYANGRSDSRINL